MAQNKEWLFSGAGLALLGAIWWIFNKLRRSRHEPQSPNPINQSPTINVSPVFTLLQETRIAESPKPEENESWLHSYNERKKVQDELDALLAEPEPPNISPMEQMGTVRFKTLREIHHDNERQRKIERRKQELKLIEERLAAFSGRQLGLDVGVDDPRIYIEFCGPEPNEGFFSGTAIVLRNDGGDVAHNVSLGPLVLTTGQVDFPSVPVLPAHNNVKISAVVENVSVFQNHDIKAALMKEWNAAGELTNEFCKKMRITYEDFRKREFETSFDLIYHPILDVHRQGRRNEALDKRNPVLTIRNVEIKRLS